MVTYKVIYLDDMSISHITTRDLKLTLAYTGYVIACIYDDVVLVKEAE